MTPVWDLNFTSPCCQLAAPYLYAHVKSCTQIWVPGPVSHPVDHWPCPGRESHPWG